MILKRSPMEFGYQSTGWTLALRVHYAGRHEMAIMVNGEQLATSFFDLSL